MAWFPTDERPARSRRRDAVIRQIDLCSLAGMSERQTIRFEPPAHQPQPAQAALPEPIGAGARATTMLLSAAIEASAIGLDRIIWPVHAGAAKEINTDALADICDRALLVGQLIGLDVAKAGQNGGSGAAPVRSVRIETPYADLNDAELMDLALDMDVPLSAAWWCLNEDPQPCAHCSGCMRWREALAAVDPAGRLDIQVLAATPATHAGPLKQK